MSTQSLIVDSDPRRWEKLELLLCQRGHQVTIAEDIETASTRILNGSFSLVFLSVDLLDLLDGQELAKSWKPKESRVCPGCLLIVGVTDGDPIESLQPLETSGLDDLFDLSDDETRRQLRLEILERRACRHPGTSQCVAERLHRLEVLLDEATDGVLIIDFDTQQILDANRTATQVLGYSKDGLIGMPVVELHPPEIRERLKRQFLELSSNEPAHSKYIPTIHRDGHEMLCDIVCSRFFHEGKPCLIGAFRDVTDQQETAQALRESENRYRLIADNVADVIWTSDVAGIDLLPPELTLDEARQLAEHFLSEWKFSYMSPSVQKMHGYDVEEAMALTINHLLCPDSLPVVTRVFAEELLEECKPSRDPKRRRTIEVRFLEKSGGYRWGEITVTFLRDSEERVLGILGVTRDMTERHLAEEALRESESMLRCLIENMPDVLLALNRDGGLKYINRPERNLFSEEFSGFEALEYLHPEHRGQAIQFLREATLGHEIRGIEFPDVFGSWWNCRVIPIEENNQFLQSMILCSNVTERKVAEEAVEKEQDLLRHLLELHERDRKMLAFELHDGFAQQLTGALYSLQGYREMLARDPETPSETFDSAVELIRLSIEETRRLIAGLRPPDLEEFGIVPAIENLIAQCQAPDSPQVEFVSRGRCLRWAQPLEIAVFRIVQETLNNARRHSQSDRVRVELACDDQNVSIQVRDWGVGFDPKCVDDFRFGLKGVRERARLLNGSAVIESTPDTGTRITVSLPLVEQAGD